MEREIHVQWKHAALVGIPVIFVLVGSATQSAVNHQRLASVERTQEARAPAVAELARVVQQVQDAERNEAEFRMEMRSQLEDLEDNQTEIERKMNDLIHLQMQALERDH